MKLFVSFAAEDEERLATLLEGLRGVGHEVWLDERKGSGRAWWSGILERIRACDAFVVAVSTATLESEACVLETDYALQLGKPVVPLLLEETFTGSIAPLDFVQQRPRAAFELIAVLVRLPKAGPLPSPLPEPPPPPTAELVEVRRRLKSEHLSLDDQFVLADTLKTAIRNPHSRHAALPMLDAFRRRSDLFGKVVEHLDAVVPLESEGAVELGAPPAAETPSARPPQPAAPAAIPPASSAPAATVVTDAQSVESLFDAKLLNLKPGYLAYNPPDRMTVGVVVPISARIARTDVEGLTVGLPGIGQVQRDTIPVNTFMAAQLLGDTFSIVVQTSEEQLVGPEQFTEWRWQVTPNKSGKRTLELSIYVRIKVSNVSEERINLPVHTKAVDVLVNPPYTVKRFISANWPVIVPAVLGSGILVWTLDHLVGR